MPGARSVIAVEAALPRAAEIVADVCSRGDEALLEWSERLDGARLESSRVPLGENSRASRLHASADAARFE